MTFKRDVGELLKGRLTDAVVTRLAGGTPRFQADVAFELGRLHRSRDSWGPRGKLAIFENPELYRAYQSGYYGPYWWEREGGSWRSFHRFSERIAYYRFLRAVYGYGALAAWNRVKQQFGGWTRRH